MTEKWTFEPGQSGRVELDRLDALKLSFARGSITVLGHDEPSAWIDISEVTELPVAIEVNGADVRVKHTSGGLIPFIDDLKTRTRASATVVVMVPHAATVDFASTSAELVLSEVTGKVNAATVGGRVTLESCGGEATLNSVTGEISVIGQSGDLTVHTVSGEVTVGGSLAQLWLNSVSAAAHLDLSGRQRRISINQASGDTQLRLDSQPLDYRINAGVAVTIDGTEYRDQRKTVRHHVPGTDPAQVTIANGLGETVIMHRSAA